MDQTCPVCNHDAHTVIERRGARRRRECGLCHYRWTTYEIPAQRLERLEKIEQHATAIAEALKDEEPKDST
jgi:transcriptional regulator NrdR family protein